MSLIEGRFKKAYLEITNVCNADCSFCPKNKRPPAFISRDQFVTACKKLRGRVEYLYFHLMGEPLLHPDISYFAEYASSCGFKVMLTTNGILSSEIGIPIVDSGNVYKISVSLHSYEANAFGMSLEDYLSGCLSLADKCAEAGTVCALRLWNIGGQEALNNKIMSALTSRYGNDPKRNRTGYKLSEYIFLEWGDKFDWPELDSNRDNLELFCYGLRNQIGILSDGTVVPCCLDSEGTVALGNLFTDSLDDILSSSRAVALYNGFTSRRPTEELCKKCGYAERFK